MDYPFVPIRWQRGYVRPSGILVDQQDAELLDLYPWKIESRGYAEWRSYRSGKKVRVALATLIARPKPGEVVDHINGNRLDNRRENLRCVPVLWNAQNQTRRLRNNTSGVRGVNWDRTRKRWIARAKVEGRRYNLGRFVSLEKAERAVVAFRAEKMVGHTPYTV